MKITTIKGDREAIKKMQRPYKMQTIRYYLLQSFLICCMGLCVYGAYSIVESNLKQATIQNEK